MWLDKIKMLPFLEWHFVYSFRLFCQIKEKKFALKIVAQTYNTPRDFQKQSQFLSCGILKTKSNLLSYLGEFFQSVVCFFKKNGIVLQQTFSNSSIHLLRAWTHLESIVLSISQWSWFNLFWRSLENLLNCLLCK